MANRKEEIKKKMLYQLKSQNEKKNKKNYKCYEKSGVIFQNKMKWNSKKEEDEEIHKYYCRHYKQTNSQCWVCRDFMLHSRLWAFCCLSRRLIFVPYLQKIYTHNISKIQEKTNQLQKILYLHTIYGAVL